MLAPYETESGAGCFSPDVWQYLLAPLLRRPLRARAFTAMALPGALLVSPCLYRPVIMSTDPQILHTSSLHCTVAQLVKCTRCSIDYLVCSMKHLSNRKCIDYPSYSLDSRTRPQASPRPLRPPGTCSTRSATWRSLTPSPTSSWRSATPSRNPPMAGGSAGP